MRVLDLESIRINHLRKQHLLEPGSGGFYGVARDHLGLHSTDYWTPYLSAWARIGDYDAKSVFEALSSGNKVVRWNAFRSTNHVVHVDNLSLIAAATGERYLKKTRSVPFLRDYGDHDFDTVVGRIIEVLEEGPKTAREIKKELPDLGSHLSWLVRIAMAKGKVVRATASHARSALTSYALTSQWLPHFERTELSVEEATSLLLKRYVEVFGPVSVNDFAWWLSSTKTEAKNAFASISNDIIECEFYGTTRYMTEEDYEASTSIDRYIREVISFLPYEDHFPKAFIERSWYLRDILKERLLPRSVQQFWPKGATPKRATSDKGPDQSGEIRPSIWLNGHIVGRWETTEEEGSVGVATSLFGRPPREIRETVDEKKDELVEFLNRRLLPISKKGWDSQKKQA